MVMNGRGLNLIRDNKTNRKRMRCHPERPILNRSCLTQQEAAKDPLLRQIVEAESIALLADCGDSATFTEASLLELATQRQHLGIHRSGSTTERRPRHAEQFLTTAHHPRRHQEGTKQGEFAGAEFNGLLTQRDLSKQQMHFQGPHSHALLQATPPALEKRATTGCKLF